MMAQSNNWLSFLENNWLAGPIEFIICWHFRYQNVWQNKKEATHESTRLVYKNCCGILT